ncbi:MAG: ArdC family protein [Armatimonadia bacterium]
MHNDRRVAALRERVVELAAAVADPNTGDEVFEGFMRWIAQLHSRYSFANTALILSAVPHATHLAGYRKWQTLGRQVRYGERGIPILVPLQGARVEEVDPLTSEPVVRRPVRGFGVGHVWDISQTDGPPVPDFKHDLGDGMQPILDAAIAFAHERGIEVEFRTLLGATNGISEGGKIVINSARPVGIQSQVILHELAHEKMHPKALRSEMIKPVVEGEAEACAWATLTHFGVDGLDVMENAALYIRSHRAGTRDILDSLERISGCAHDLISGLERHLPPELRLELPHAG